MKRVGNLYSQIAEPDNLRLAFWKAQRGKGGKQDVEVFRRALAAQLRSLREELLAESVALGDYHYFTVFDPKERRICAASFKERVLHHAIMNICAPAFERYQAHDSYASRPGKGTYAALARAQVFARRYEWYLKLDVRKYFDSIDHAVLAEQLKRLFKDPQLLRLFGRIIATYETERGRGVPIGNLTSQFFANHYLAVLDHRCKEELRVPAYVRYMDDMLLWHDDKDALVAGGHALRDLADRDLRLELKPFCLNRTSKGVSFLGYRVFPWVTRLTRRSRTRYAAKLEHCYESLASGEWTQGECADHVAALVAFTEHAQARGFRRKVLENVGCCPRARTA